MNKILDNILPKTVDNDYRGNTIALWFFVVLAIVSTVRSLIHFLAPDGGAGSIAGLDLSKGGENIFLPLDYGVFHSYYMLLFSYW